MEDIIRAAEVLPMMPTRISLGNGITMYLSVFAGREVASAGEILQSITDFRISRDDLKKFEPTYKELFEIYSAIRAYRMSVSCLRELKNKA